MGNFDKQVWGLSAKRRHRTAYAEIHHDDRAATAVAFTVRAIACFAAHGVAIERVMTDNGSCYRSRDFRHVLADHGIAHKRTRPYRPQTNCDDQAVRVAE